MKIVRAGRLHRFVALPNDAVEDVRLSYRARGLLAYLLSRPDGWHTDSTRLAAGAKEGRDAVRAALGELEAIGYLLREKYRDRETGRWLSSWEVVDTPGSVLETRSDPELETRSGDGLQEQDETAGHAQDWKTGVGKPGPTNKTDNNNQTPTESGRATRLPSSFPVTAEMRAWADRMVPDLVASGRASREHDNFCDYWHAAAGRSSRKIDWVATWRRWMRKAADDLPRAQQRAGRPTRQEETDQLFDEAMERARARDAAQEAASEQRAVCGPNPVRQGALSRAGH